MLNVYPLTKATHWLLAIATVVILIHFSILEQLGEQNLFALHFLILTGIISLVWDKKNQLRFESHVTGTLTGMLLLAIVYLRMLSPQDYQINFSPLIIGFSLGLLAEGFQGIWQFWKELLLLITLAILPFLNIILDLISLSTLTAKFSSFLIWVVGFNVEQQGKLIILPQGRVEVLKSCAGFDLIALMLTCAVLVCLMFPSTLWQKIKYLTVAPLLGFIVNCIRVIFLTFMVSSRNQNAFQYWHSEEGGLIFSMIAVVLFAIFTWYFGLKEFAQSSIKS